MAPAPAPKQELSFSSGEQRDPTTIGCCSKDFSVGSAGLVMLAPRHPARPSLRDQTSKGMNLTAGEVGLVLERCREQGGGGERAQLATAMESHGEDVTIRI